MNILAVDTATKSCSVAVFRDRSLASEMTVVSRKTHSLHLMRIIRIVLEGADLSLGNIDGFAVTKGPGSFTGLRIGISTVKGMAAALEKPIVGVSNFEAAAFCIPETKDPVFVMLDARKNEVYRATFRYLNGELVREGDESVLSPEEALEKADPGSCWFVGDGASLYRGMIEEKMGAAAKFPDQSIRITRASAVAALSLSRFDKGFFEDPATFAPLYIRKSDAELSLSQKKM